MNITKRASNKVTEIPSQELLYALNQMVADWQKHFDVFPPKAFSYLINEQGMLCLDDIVICHADDVNIHDLSSGCDAFFIGSKTRGYYRISIVWTYTDQIYIDEVSLVLYAC